MNKLDLDALAAGITPGPWRYSPHTTIDVRDSKGGELAETRNGGFTFQEQTSNARAIAALPDLIALARQQRDALRRIAKMEERANGVVGMVDSPHVKALRAASEIARAALAATEGGE